MKKILPHFFSRGDFIDLFHLIRLKGLKFILQNFSLINKDRVRSKWNQIECSDSDFWIIPEVKREWNKKCTGEPEVEYEDYVVEKYLRNLSGLKMLSVGCGNSSHEQTFSKHPCFDSVEGIDISEKQLIKARYYAEEDNCKKVTYRVHDFEKESLPENEYDVVLFHSSLHHFKSIENIISERTIPILKKNGLLIIFDYTGPNRLQWTSEQLNKSNELLRRIPRHRRFRPQSNFLVKKRVYRPGKFRMWVSDPSEAIDSEAMLETLARHLNVLEEKKLGGNLIHPLLKGIAHHFIDNSAETMNLLNTFFKEEELFLKNNSSDFTFGIYRKK